MILDQNLIFQARKICNAANVHEVKSVIAMYINEHYLYCMAIEKDDEERAGNRLQKFLEYEKNLVKVVYYYQSLKFRKNVKK